MTFKEIRSNIVDRNKSISIFVTPNIVAEHLSKSLGELNNVNKGEFDNPEKTYRLQFNNDRSKFPNKKRD